VAVDVLAAEIDEESARIDMGDVRLVGDHDYFAALARVLEFSGAKVGSKALWTGFLAAVMCDHVGRTDWFSAVREWGSASSREVIKCPCAI
jgi:hypothetical protein